MDRIAYELMVDIFGDRLPQAQNYPGWRGAGKETIAGASSQSGLRE